jgi:hypothetical protein
VKLKAVSEIDSMDGCKGCIFEDESECIDSIEVNGEIINCYTSNVIFVEDKETVEIKQLTLEELREQFEKTHSFLNLNRNSNNNYIDSTANLRWDSYICCAEQNGILKE